MATAFFAKSCCCSCSSLGTTTSPGAGIFRMRVQCPDITQTSPTAKIVVSGARCRATVRENGDDRTNFGSGSGNSVSGSFTNTCSCIVNVGSIGLSCVLRGRYKPPFGGVGPYAVAVNITLGGIYFVCENKSTIAVYSNYVFATNVSENPAQYNQVGGLNSSGSLTLSLFGQSTTISLPYNTWDPDWQGDEGYSALWNITGKITLGWASCE